MLGHDVARSGATAAELRPPFARDWYRLFADEGLQSGVQPIIADGKVYLGTLAGILHAMDVETGKDVWTFRAGGPILHAAAAGPARVYFGAADGLVYAINIVDGAQAWTFRTGAAIWNAPVLHQDMLCIGSRDGRVYALDAESGVLRWSADTGAPLLNSPAIDPGAGRLYIASEALRVHAFDVADGRELWRSDRLPGASARGYHPVIAPDGSVMVTTQPVIGYDQHQNLLLDMVRAVLGDFASWRHKKADNDRLREENFRQLERPETYDAQLDYLRRRLTDEPAFQSFFVLDPATGHQRFVAPIVASESMNGPAAPPVVTPDGRVIVKYQVLLRSRYEHYSPFLNVGWLDPATGRITPLMDQTRTYGWHDSLLLVHDEQCQLSVAGRLLLNTHQDNVNALDLVSLEGHAEPLARNVHEPAPGEALGIRLAAWRGDELPVGKEWLMRGTAVYGGGSTVDVAVAVAGDRFFYLPTHELNAGCALIAYRMAPGAEERQASAVAAAGLEGDDWQRVQELPWDWDTLGTPRLRSLLQSLPGPVPGTLAAPLESEARAAVAALAEAELDRFIWEPAWDPAADPPDAPAHALSARLQQAVRELLERTWRPLVLPAGKAPETSYRVLHDPSETVYTLLLARALVDDELQTLVDQRVAALLASGLPRTYAPDEGDSRVAYDVPRKRLQVADDPVRDDLARLYVVWLWSRTPGGAQYVAAHWQALRERLHTARPETADDCGNARLAGLLAYCRLARAAGDDRALADALPVTREALRERLRYEFAYPRGGLMVPSPVGRTVIGRWRRLTPDVAALLAAHARPTQQHLMDVYVDYHRPGWWLAWNVEQLMRNEAPMQLPTTPLDIFTARALVLDESPEQLEQYLDLPWCRADEYFIQKLALILRGRERR